VWDDVIFLRDAGGLRYGSNWIQFVLHGFDNWLNYFRPLGVALLAAETRLLDVAPAPMHLLSLGLHLINTLLVGALARTFAIAPNPPDRNWLLPLIAMLLFGLHPVLVEPVVWIASQFELLLTLFTLLGLLANLTLRNRGVRAAIVALCFFLAACSKETAIAFPLLLLIVDWLRPIETSAVSGPWQFASARLRQQWPIYAAVLIAGLAYLAARYWGLGFLINSYGHTTSLSWPRVHLISFTYLAYWKLLVWPMIGLGPIHIVPAQQFADFTAATVTTDAAALAIALSGLYLLWKREPLGGLIMGVTAALLPVLHVIPIEFEESLYHDRYAMTAVAIASAFLPNVAADLLGRHENRRLATLVLLFAAGWLVAGVINIRVTVPLWSDEAKLWEWALGQNPGSTIAQDRLFGTYLDRHDLARAEPLAEVLEKTGKACASCMLKVASLAVTQGNAARARDALREVKRSVDADLVPQRLVAGYFLISGNLSRLQHDNAEAENYYRGAIELNPLNPHGYMSLAMLLAEERKVAGAREAFDVALSLYAPAERDQRRREFERFLATRPPNLDDSTVPPPSPR
jgi:tetratricopeptide (TPR) repeat protein